MRPPGGRSTHHLKMLSFATFFLSFLLFLAPSCSYGLRLRDSDPDGLLIMQHQERHVKEFHHVRRGRSSIEIDYTSLQFENERLRNAYVALQAWKKAISSDPYNITGDWFGSDVCNYTGVFCETALYDRCITTVAGIDLNHADLAGYLPEELGLLSDLALFHINSNRFYGKVPLTLHHLKLLFELDLSNNRFVGGFPHVVLSLPGLRYLDIRFNQFEGPLPYQLFTRKLDAIFVNNNQFNQGIPANLGSSPVSVLVLANNKFSGCVPHSLGNMGSNLEEILLINNSFKGCLNPSIGQLKNLTVLDVSDNQLTGELPRTIGAMSSLEVLNVADNEFYGSIPPEICGAPSLENFTFSYNFIEGEAINCFALSSLEDNGNCIVGRPAQRLAEECASARDGHKKCEEIVCGPLPPPPPPPPTCPVGSRRFQTPIPVLARPPIWQP